MTKEIISTKNAPQAIGPYSQAVKTNNLMFISNGNLIFKNPIVNLTSYRLNVDKSNKFNTYDIEITPQAGSLLIFPSYVSHKIDVHKSDIPRLSLAFNMVPVGQYGIGDSQADTSWISK